MRSVKNIILLVVSVAALYVGYSYYLSFQNPCERPLEYAIGRFDPQFGISEEEFQSDIALAGLVWEEALGKGVFVYDPDAKFKVNLIYDERQIATVQKQKTESGLVLAENAFKRLDSGFRTSKMQYEQRVAAYEEAFDNYEERKSAYEKEVEHWKGKGGAPEDKYEALEEERQYLNTEAARLNAEISAINSLAAELNTVLVNRNSKASEYNKAAQEYNKRYNQGLEFNQAEYTGTEINVYQFGTKDDLILALAHEFGHALNMGHVENPESVMYYLTGINASSDLSLSAEDLAELGRVCEK